jgi:hypothetical protein
MCVLIEHSLHLQAQGQFERAARLSVQGITVAGALMAACRVEEENFLVALFRGSPSDAEGQKRHILRLLSADDTVDPQVDEHFRWWRRGALLLSSVDEVVAELTMLTESQVQKV